MKGLAQQAPSIREVDPHALVIGFFKGQPLCLTFLRHHKGCKLLQHSVTVGSEIRRPDRDPDLLLIGRILQSLDQGLDHLALFFQLGSPDDDLGRQIGPVIQEIVLLQSRVAGRFYSQLTVGPRFIKLDRLVNHIPVAPLEAQVLQAQILFQEGRQLPAGDAVRHDRRARMVFRGQSCRHGDDPVAGDLPAPAVHGCRPVHIRIEDQAQVRLRRKCLHGNRGHGFPVLRIGRVVQEHAVRLQILTAADIRAQGLQHFLRVESSGAVARVHRDLKPLQRLVSHAAAIDDQPAQVGAVGSDDIRPFRREDDLPAAVDETICVDLFAQDLQLLLRAAVSRKVQDLRDVLLVQPSLRREELEPVPVKRQVACRDHDSPVTGKLRKHRCHEHSRRRCQTAVQDPASVGAKAIHQAIGQLGSRDPGIPAHSQLQLLRLLPGPAAEPGQKACRYIRRRLLRQVGHLHRTSGGRLAPVDDRDSPDVASILQFAVISHFVSSLENGQQQIPVIQVPCKV